MRERVYADIDAERDRQDAKWGDQSHAYSTWMTILGEEVGEACEETLAVEFSRTLEDEYNAMFRLREELVQVAAVAVQILEKLDGTQEGAE